MATTTPADPALSPAQVALLFGVAARTVVRWCDDGRLPHFWTAGGQRRILTSDAEALRKPRPATSLRCLIDVHDQCDGTACACACHHVTHST